MKIIRNILIPAAILAALGQAQQAVAQKGKLVDRREQAEGWYLPVHGNVTAGGKKADGIEVVLYKDNEELGKLEAKSGQFELELDIDQVYTVRVLKKGFQEKLLYFNTKLPENLVNYPDYMCFVNLAPPSNAGVDPFYTDFPSAIVHWDENQGGFYHSEHYLAHIQTRLNGIASAGN